MKRLLLATLVFALALAGLAADAARPLLAPLFGEHMMLQRNRPTPIWGWAAAGTEITVTFAGQKKTAVAGSDGRWQVTLDPLSASATPQEFTVTAANRESKIENQKFTDILVGDLWLCSGQSNMAFGLTRSLNGAEAAKAASHPGIRLFRVPQKSAYVPVDVPAGTWLRCEPAAFETGPGFSAVAYYFGRKVHAETGVPIGLIVAAVGGAPAESFMSPAALQAMPDFGPGLAEITRLRETGAPVYGNYIMHWYDSYDRGLAQGWKKADADTVAWQSVSLKEGFAKLGAAETPAVVWFRREITLPDPLPAGAARLLLGVVERMDTAWVNDQWVGASAWVENPRAYNLPAAALRPGRNVVTIRVLKTAPDGGFRSPANALKLTLGDGTTIPLEGEWRATLSVDARPPHPLPLGYENWPSMPTVLHQGMLRPLAPVALAGALWYQGEANFTRARQYRTLLPAMIADWRQLYQQPNLPVYIASLPAFMKRRDQPGTDGWTDLREAQALTARNVPHTGLAVTVDTGDADDIHPTEKKPVGERLALLALRDVYGKKVVSQGPTFARAEKIPGGLRLHFTHTDGGLVTKGDKLCEFSVAGTDRAWHWAEARIEGNTVVVTSAAVSAPVAVRYAWQANPLATLYNGAELPAEPFRSDDW